jgi:hypothetical protein
VVCLVYYVCLVCLVNQIAKLISPVRNRHCTGLPE